MRPPPLLARDLWPININPIPKKNKNRLDSEMVDRGLAPTRTKAQALVIAGRVMVNGELQTKAGHLVSSQDDLAIKPGARFVSRGGDKLLGALEEFSIDPEGRNCLDVGSSTGGFTDCLLQKGASSVLAIDVGRAQLDSNLGSDPRVTLREETHILTLTPEDIRKDIDLCVVDVSFISLKKVLPHLKNILPPKTEFVSLIKPQFEVGPKWLKKGVVRSEEVRQKCLEDLRQFCEDLGFTVLGLSDSRLKGPKGNQETFIHLEN